LCPIVCAVEGIDVLEDPAEGGGVWTVV